MYTFIYIYVYIQYICAVPIHMHIYIYMYIYTYVYRYTYIYRNIHIYIHMYVYIYINIPFTCAQETPMLPTVNIEVFCRNVCIYLCIYIYVYTHVYIYIFIYVLGGNIGVFCRKEKLGLSFSAKDPDPPKIAFFALFPDEVHPMCSKIPWNCPLVRMINYQSNLRLTRNICSGYIFRLFTI